MTLALSQKGLVGPFPARVIAFLCAATVTVWCHRRFAFRHRAGTASLPLYLATTAAGALINIGVDGLWLDIAGQSAKQIFLGVAAGSVVALGFNFLVTRWIVFRQE